MNKTISLRNTFLLSVFILLAACTQQSPQASPVNITSPTVELAEAQTPTVHSEAASPTPPAETPTPQTDAPLPPLPPQPYYVFPPYGMYGTQAWQIVDGQPVSITLPDFAQNAYDLSAVSGRILHPSGFPDQGGGPANLSVGDLFIYDIQTQVDTPVFTDPSIVEAVWSPNGLDFVYLLATDSTYELRFRTSIGEDRLLASDVSPVFDISPDGKLVAFTRETGYEVGEPGVYVVDVTGGQERQVSDVDRGGEGSISDVPLWSPDSRYFLLPVSPSRTPLGWVLVAADGSLSQPLSYAPGVPESFLQANFTPSLWLPDGSGFVGVQEPGMMDAPYTQETAVASLDLATGQVTALTPVNWGALNPVSWETPGSRLWQINDEGSLVLLDLTQPQPFPASCKQSGLYTFANPLKGYCFAYPQDVVIQAYEFERPVFLGPALDDSVEPRQARLWVETAALPEGGNLQSAVDAFMTGQPQGDPAMTRTPATLGGEPAELVENVPGQLFSKVLITVKDGMIYYLWFNPADPAVPEVAPDVQRLFETVTGSFAWLPSR